MARINVTNEQITAAQGGDAGAMWEIVEAFDGLINSVIRSVAPRASVEQREDYLQDGRAALLQMIHDYDSSVSADSVTGRLMAYVQRGIRRTIAEADVVNSTAHTVEPSAALRVKQALWETGRDVEKAWEKFRDAESTRRMSRESFLAMVEALEGAESLDAPIGDGDEGEALTLADVVADPCADVTSPTERRDYARWLMTQIAPRQAFALKAFYGVNMTAIPDAEAAAELGVKPARLRTLRHDGCESARKVAASKYWVPQRHEYGRTLAPAA